MKNNNLLLPIVILVVAVIAAIVLFFVVKKDQVISPKKTILVILLGALILAVPATLIFFGLPYMPTLYLICAVYNLLMGWAYLAYYPNMLITPGQHQWWVQLLILLLTTLIGASLFIIIFHFLSDVDYGLMVGSPISFAFIPLFFSYTFDALLSIPMEIYKVWHYNQEVETHWFDDQFSGMLVFQVELYKNQEDLNLTKVKAKAPNTIIFKDWFHRFLDDFNKKYPQIPIECISYGNEPFGWVFYVKPKFWPVKRYIDFEKTIYENEIDDRSVIVAKRVVEDRYQPEAYQSPEKLEEPVEREAGNVDDAKLEKEADQSKEESSVAEQKGNELVNQGSGKVQEVAQKLFSDRIPKV